MRTYSRLLGILFGMLMILLSFAITAETLLRKFVSVTLGGIDELGGYAGPLAGMLTALMHCETPYLLTVPCDTPRLPLDLAQRLCQALTEQQADLAMAAAPEADGRVRTQPVFCLLGAHLLESLSAFLQEGGRKIDAWAARHRCAVVSFDRPDDDPLAFTNINTRGELHALQQATASP